MNTPTVFIGLLFLGIVSSCTQNNVQENKTLKPFFEKNNVTGCFAIYDNAHGEFTIHNLKRYRDSAYSPASTFKIVNSLIGFETGKITREDMVLKWDGKPRMRPEWNQDLRYDSAFRYSAVWYFQEIARMIGRDTMKWYIDSLQYGNKNISGAIDSFWLNNNLKVRPDEQLGLMKQLYFNQLSNLFSERSMNKVKEAMLAEKTDKYALSYKTGLTETEQGHPLAWIVGWIEEGNQNKPYFFVLNIESANPSADLRSVRMTLLKDLLKHLGYLQGKKG
jgi:beta-lactamase class D